MGYIFPFFSKDFSKTNINVDKNVLSPLGSGWWNNNWSYCKLITIDHTKVGATLTNYPILFDNTSTDYIKAQGDGDDFAFVSYDNSSQYNHELEWFNVSGDNRLIAWVNITSLSGTEDTLLWLYYGNPSCVSQQNVVGTWNSNYLAVYHMNQASSTVVDSKWFFNSTSVTSTPLYQQTGKIGYSMYFDGDDDSIVLPKIYNSETTWCAQTWIYPYENSHAQYVLSQYAASSGFMLYDASTSSEVSGWINGSVQTEVIACPYQSWYLCSLPQDSSGNLYLQVNLTKTTTYVKGTPSWGSTTVFNISNRPAGSRGFKGYIDEVRLSNINRNFSWVCCDYNTTSSPSTFLSIGSELLGETRNPFNVFDFWFLCGNITTRIGTQVFINFFVCSNNTQRNPFVVLNNYFNCGNITSRNPAQVFNYWFLCGNATSRSPFNVFDYWFNCENITARNPYNVFDNWFLYGNTTQRMVYQVLNKWFLAGNLTLRNPFNVFDFYFVNGNITSRSPFNVFDNWFLSSNITTRIPSQVFNYWFQCDNGSTRQITQVFDNWFLCDNNTQSFGYSTAVTGGASIEDCVRGSPFQCNGNGYADYIMVKLDNNNATYNYTGKVKCAIYNYPSLNFITETEDKNLTIIHGADSAWHRFDFTNKPYVLNNSYYVLVGWAENKDGNIRMLYNTPVIGNILRDDEVYGIFPNPIVLTSNINDYLYNIYCSYTMGVETRDTYQVFDYWFNCNNGTRTPVQVFGKCFNCSNVSNPIWCNISLETVKSDYNYSDYYINLSSQPILSFGRNTGDTYNDMHSILRSSSGSPVHNGFVSSCWANFETGSWINGEKVKMGLYWTSNNTFYCETQERSDGGNGWQEFNFTSSYPVYIGTSYYVSLICNNTVRVLYQSGTSVTRIIDDYIYPNWPTTSSTSTGVEYAYFCEYTYNESIIINTGNYNVSGYLLIRLDYNDSGNWVTVNEIINETNPRTINASDYLGLSNIWNGNCTINNLSNGSGMYRVYACLRYSDWSIIQNFDSSYIENYTVFNYSNTIQFFDYYFRCGNIIPKIYYISNNGADSNNGTSPDTPWQNISKINTEMNTGLINESDDILFKRGDFFTGQLNIKIGGNKNNYTIIGAYGTGDNPIIDNSGVDDGNCIIIWYNSLGYIIIQDLQFRNTSVAGDGISIYGDTYNKNYNDIIIRNIYGYDLGGVLIHIERTINYTIENCIGNGSAIICLGDYNNRLSNGTIINCTVYDAPGDCFQLHRAHTDTTNDDAGSNHYFYNCTAYNAGENCFDITAGQNIIFDSCEGWNSGSPVFEIGHDLENLTIQNCYAHDSPSAGISVGDSSNVIIRYNKVWNTSDDSALRIDESNGSGWNDEDGYLENCTIYNNDFIYPSCFNGSLTNRIMSIDYAYFFDLVLKNNIFASFNFTPEPDRFYRVYGTGVVIPPNDEIFFDNNVWWNSNGNSANTWWFTGDGSINLSGWNNYYPDDVFYNPGFINVETGDLSLNMTSPCIDAGAWLTQTNSSSTGTVITVIDDSYFMDGYGLVDGDIIFVGDDTDLMITDINYNLNQITVNRSITWTDGDNVSLNHYYGNSIDIGAKEFSGIQFLNIFDSYFVCSNDTSRTPVLVFDNWFLCNNGTGRTPTKVFDYWFQCKNTSFIPINVFDTWYQCSNGTNRVNIIVFDYWFQCNNYTLILITNVYPVNGSIGIPLQPTLYLTVNHSTGSIMNLSFYYGPSLNNTPYLLGSYNNQINGTYPILDYNATNRSTNYFWRIQINDGNNWVNRSYMFRTEGYTGGLIPVSNNGIIFGLISIFGVIGFIFVFRWYRKKENT